MVNPRVKKSATRDLGIRVEHIWGTFVLVVFVVIM